MTPPNNAPAPEWPESKLAEIEEYYRQSPQRLDPWREPAATEVEFYARARTDLPEAVAEIRRLRAQVDVATRLLSASENSCGLLREQVVELRRVLHPTLEMIASCAEANEPLPSLPDYYSHLMLSENGFWQLTPTFGGGMKWLPEILKCSERIRLDAAKEPK